MPAESIKTPVPAAENVSKKKSVVSSSGKAALAKVTLLDGSVLDVSIDVSKIL